MCARAAVSLFVLALTACSSAPVAPAAPKPDLTGDTLSLVPSRVAAGGTGQLIFALRNLGAADAGPFSLRATLQREDGGAAMVLARLDVAGVSAGASTPQSLTVQLPDDAQPGVHTLTVAIDPEGQVDESSRDNNVVVALSPVTILAPRRDVNLAVAGLSLTPREARAGDQVVARYTVANGGTSSVPAGMKVRLFLSLDAERTNDDAVLGEDLLPSLGAGESLTRELRFDLPAGLRAGTYAVLAIADPDDALAETSENDNVATAPLGVAEGVIHGVDLAVVALSLAPEHVQAGGSATVRLTLVNRGDAPTPASFLCRLYLAGAPTLEPATALEVGVLNVSGLGAGESSTFERVVTIPGARAPGTSYVAAIADPGDATGDVDRSNNLRVATLGFTVLPTGRADLALTALSFAPVTPGPATAGAELLVDLAVTNRGPDEAGAFRVSFFLTRGVPAADDRPLGGLDVASLGVNETQRLVHTTTLPADLPPGRYYLGARADAEARILDPERAGNVRLTGPAIDVGAVTACADDALEPNNARSAPAVVGAGTYAGLNVCDGNEDWYRISVPAGSRLTVRVVPVPSPLATSFGIGLYSARTGDLLYNIAGVPGTREASADFSGRDEDYLVWIGGRGQVAYTMTVTLIDGGGDGIDLLPQDISFGEQALDPGAPFYLQFAARNLGKLDSPPFEFEVSLVPATSACTQTISLGVEQGVPLPGGERRTLERVFVLPPGTCPGPYRVRVVLDPQGRIGETFEDNNTVTAVDTLTIGTLGGCGDDRFEPNDTPALAPTLASGTYQGLQICPNDDDWYAVYVAAGATLEVRINPSGTTPVGFGLVPDDGRALLPPLAPNFTDRVSHTAPRAQRVFIYARGYSGSAAGYRMVISGAAGVDLAASSLSVTPPRQAAGRDLQVRFAVENLLPLVSPATTVLVRLRRGAAEAVARTLAVPPLGPGAAAGSRIDFDVPLTLPAELAPGLYTVEALVDPAGALQQATRENDAATLDGFEVSQCAADALAPNGSPETAADVTPPAGAGTSSYPTLSVCAGDTDWFRVVVGDAPRELSVRIAFSNAAGDLDLTLYRAEPGGALRELARSHGTSDVEEVAERLASAGTYLLRVAGFDHAANHYALDVTLRAP